MTQLYHLASNPLIAAGVSRHPVEMGFVRTSDTVITLAANASSLVWMRNAQAHAAILAIDANTTRTLDTAVTGVGGLDEAVGGDRGYPVHIIATANGQTFGLLGVRLGTAIADALPTGYTWYSRALAPCLTMQDESLYEWWPETDGWFAFLQNIEVLASGTTAAAATAINLQTLEIVDGSVKKARIYATLVNAAAVQTGNISILNLGATYTTIWSQPVGNVAPNADRQAIEMTIPIVNPTTGLAYGWGGGPTGGTTVSVRAVQY